MFDDLLKFAKENDVPIIRDQGLEFLIDSINKHNVKSCLEVGTAIAYSAIRMAHLGVNVTTLERNPIMYEEAIKNVKKYEMEEKIECVFTDALEYEPKKKYDLIFIDAAKSQNRKFFLRFIPFLNDDGIVVIDNLNFHGLTDVDPATIESRNVRAMVRKINEFKVWLRENEEFDTVFTDMGDGMSLSKRRK